MTIVNALCQDTLTASTKEKLLFSLNYRSMQYWMAEASVQRKEISQMDTIIQLYEKQTGVFRNNTELMKQNFALKTDIAKTCVPELKTCTDKLEVFKGRANRRGWTIGVGMPVAIGFGFTAGVIYQAVK